jgi:phosphatidylinositol glycan class F
MATIKSSRPKDPPSYPAIDIVSAAAAQTYAHIHPALLLSIYALRFRALVADPISTLLTSLPLLAALQMSYVVVCLPAARSRPVATSSESPRSGIGLGAGTGTLVKLGKGGQKRKQGGGVSKELGSGGGKIFVRAILGHHLILTVRSIEQKGRQSRTIRY